MGTTTETVPHDLEARLDRIEKQLGRLLSLVDRFMPLIEQYEKRKGAIRQAFAGKVKP